MIRSASDFGRLVREKRKALKLSQDQLAEQSGVSRPFVYSLEAGKGAAHLDKALMVALAVGLELGDLRSRVADVPEPEAEDDDLSSVPRF